MFARPRHEPWHDAWQRASHCAEGGVPLHEASHLPWQVARHEAWQRALASPSPAVALHSASQLPSHEPSHSAEQLKLPGLTLQRAAHP